MKKRAYSLASSKDLRLASRKRDLYSSKRDNGKVMIVGGSEDYHGAPALALTAAYSLLGALRIGIGYAVAYVPRSVLTANRSVSADIIVKPTSGNNLNLNDIPMLKKGIDSSDCLVIGMGIGRSAKTLLAASKLVSCACTKRKRIVIDADAIRAIKRHKVKLNKDVVITPNDSEFRLFYGKVLGKMDLNSRIAASITVSKSLNCNVLLKGHKTIVTDGKRTKVISSRSTALAVMGTGDVLAGIIGGFASKNDDMFIAAVAGAYLHRTIGDALYKNRGTHILASDVVDYIPKVLKRFDKKV